jgi:hypothetical protein
MCEEDNKIFFFGYGTYDGDFVPEASERVLFWGLPLDHPNPRITLDGSGKHVYGCECWWGPEEQIKKMLTNRKVIIVDITEQRLKKVAGEA